MYKEVPDYTPERTPPAPVIIDAAIRYLGTSATTLFEQASESNQPALDIDQERREQAAIHLAQLVLGQDRDNRHSKFVVVAAPPAAIGRSRPIQLPHVQLGWHRTSAPVLLPRAMLTLVGKNYEKLNTFEDTHHVSIGIIGNQLYADTTPWTELTCDEEIYGYRNAMNELFGAQWQDDPLLNNMRVVPLGRLDRIGRFQQIRPTNRVIFGMEWVRLMHVISGPSAPYAAVEILPRTDIATRPRVAYVASR